jgi:hypothetical protein
VYRGAGPKHGGAKHIGRLGIYLCRNALALVLGAGIPSVTLALMLIHADQFMLSKDAALLSSSGDPTLDVSAVALFVMDQAFKGGLNDFAEVFEISLSPITLASDAISLKVAIWGYRLLVNAIAFFALWRVLLCMADLCLLWAKRPKDNQGRNRFNFTKTSRGYVEDMPEFTQKIGSPSGSISSA